MVEHAHVIRVARIEDPSSLVLISRWKGEEDMLRVNQNAAEIRRAAELIEHEDVQHLVAV